MVHYKRKLKLIVGLLGIRVAWREDGEFSPSASYLFLANSWTPRNRPHITVPPGTPRDSSQVDRRLTTPSQPLKNSQRNSSWPATRVRRIHNFFWILFASYLHVSVYSLTSCIYSDHLLHVLFKIFAQIHIQKLDLIQNKYMLKRISPQSEYSLQRFLILGLANIHFKIFVLMRIFAKPIKFHIQANIRLQIFAYKQIFAKHCFKLYGKAFHKS
jgi:hypothetical protein